MRTRLAGWLLMIGLASAGAALAQQQQSQTPPPPPPQSQKEDPLLEASRKAKAEKKDSPPHKVYTEDDLSHLKGNDISVVGGGTSAASSEAKNSDAREKSEKAARSEKNSEAYWRGRANKLKNQIAEVDQQIEKMQEEIKKGGGASFDVTKGLQHGVAYVHDNNAKLAQLQKRKDALLKQMEALEEEGRRAGADPGWFR